MKSKMMILLLLLISTLIHAQYDEKQILTQQANQYMVQRQYSEAERLYLELLEKYPTDLGSILQLMQLYFNLNQSEKAEAHLARFQRVLPQNTYSEQHIQLLLLQGLIDDAKRESEAYLDLYSHDQSKYRLMAMFFERRGFHDYAIELYEQARSRLGKSIFSLEIANSAMQAQRPKLALSEYLQHMASANNANQYIKNQIAGIVKADSTLIEDVKEFSETHPSPLVLELYAYTLVSIKHYSAALEIYKSLPETYLRDFALEQLRLQNYEVALPAYRHLASVNNQPFQRISYHLEVARILHQVAEYDSSTVELSRILQDAYWGKNPANQRNPLYVSIRKLIAQNAMAKGEDISVVQRLTEEAKSYANQALTRQELELELARLAILSGDFDTADKTLDQVTLEQVSPTKDYLYFLSAFMQNDMPQADSLMNDYMLKHPGNDFANDIIYLNMLSINMQAPQQKRFSSAISLLQQMKPAGVDSLYSIFRENGDEELLLLAIEWAIGMNDIPKAEAMLDHEFSDPLASEYASFMRLALSGNPEEENALARDFLKTKPNSIFSPGFRQVISRVANSRISL